VRQGAAAGGYGREGAARKIAGEDCDRLDLSGARGRDSRADIRRKANRGGGGRAEIRLLSSFLGAGSEVDVPDPYYGGDEGFETVIDMIEEACPAILDHLSPPR